MSQVERWIAIILLVVIAACSVLQTPAIMNLSDKAPKRDKAIETPVADDNTKVGIFVESADGKNSNYYIPDESGIVEATFPGPGGEQVNIQFRKDQNEIHVSIVSPGAHPGPDPTE